MSHGLLLFRSRRTTDTETRVDVLIHDVRASELRYWFDGINIQEVGVDYLGPFASRPKQMVERGNRIYELSGGGWNGFIVGGIMQLHEDIGWPMEKSALLDFEFP